MPDLPRTNVPSAMLAGPRVRLRQWSDADNAPFAALNADPEVMAHFPATLSREQSDATAGRIRRSIDTHGWGFWAADDISGLDEIVAMTQLGNARSRAVMLRLGMREASGEEFEHPDVPVGSHARAMCLYRLPRAAWRERQHA